MHIAVLGSKGQIGKPLCSYLSKKGYEVKGYDKHNCNLEESCPDLEQFDYVFFLAFNVGGSKYLKEYEHTFQFLDSNMRIMTNVFAELAKSKVGFMFASSQMSDMNWSTYGVLKKLGERYTKALRGEIVRFWNVYGEEENNEKSHVITDFIRMALNDREIRMKTDGKEMRQFLHVDDCCEALYNLMLLDSKKSWDVTSFKWTSIREIAKIVSGLTGAVVVPGQESDSVQASTQNMPDPSILEIWKPEISLLQGINKLISKI